MKIALMLRAMDQESGFRAYIEGLVESLLAIDSANTYLLFYRTPKYFGRFAGAKNAKEFLLRAPHKFAWDQIAVPFRAWREGADVIFNPKFSVPLISSCPVAMGIQEPDWYVYSEYYERFDGFYNRVMIPIYARRCTHLFPMSRFDLEESKKYLGLPLRNVTVTYTCPGPHMQPVSDAAALATFREAHQLPEQFLLCVTRVDHPGLDGFEKKKFFAGKNPESLLRAFLLCRDQLPHHLVFAGRRVRDYFLTLGFRDADFAKVHFIDFVPYAELHKLYNCAAISIVPTYYDGCSTTMLESMACGCPVIASKTDAGPEIGEDAALYVDPRDPAELAAKIRSIVQNPGLRRELSARGLARAAFFNWKRTAEDTLSGLTQAARNGRRKEGSAR